MSFGGFKPEQIAHAAERQNSLEQLERLGSVWIGSDIALERTTIVNPGQLDQGVRIILNKKDLPPGLIITRGALSALNLSVRSFFAQVGIDITFHGSSLTSEMLSDIRMGKNVPVPVDIVNHGQRAVELAGHIMRFFWINDHRRLRRLELLHAVKSGEFVVEGVEGEDWFLGGYNPDEKIMTTGDSSDKGLCVVTRLKPERYYIPYAPEPVRKSNDRSIRDNLSDFLKPIPPDMNLAFEISETPKVKVGPHIVAVINTGAGKGQKHINSSLVDSGSDWPIRTETLHGLKYIEFFLYKK